MSKIVKKKDLDVLIESTLEKAGITIKKEETVTTETVVTETVVETKVEDVITETIEPKKEVINEDIKREIDMFKKLSNYTYKK